MSLRAPRETLDSLRLTLQNLEQTTDVTSDSQEFAELKRILLTRIADLEMVDALNAQSLASAGPVDQPADLLPLEIVASEAQPEPAPTRVDEEPDIKP